MVLRELSAVTALQYPLDMRVSSEDHWKEMQREQGMGAHILRRLKKHGSAHECGCKQLDVRGVAS